MARYAVLNNVMHKGLRVVTRFGSEFGDDVGMVPAFPTEYAELQREYPIFLRRDRDSDAWQSVALLGFAQRENLFVRDGRWNANYLPGAIAKGPFLIGFQETRVDGELRNEPVIHVDMEHPRIGREEGEAVFLPQGGHSAYLEHVITVLRGIRDGAEAAVAMFAAFDSLGLIQPMTVELKFDDQHGANMTGLAVPPSMRAVMLGACLGVSAAFSVLGLNDKDGWKYPMVKPGEDFIDKTKEAFTAWLAGPGKDYQVSKLVPKKK